MSGLYIPHQSYRSKKIIDFRSRQKNHIFHCTIQKLSNTTFSRSSRYFPMSFAPAPWNAGRERFGLLQKDACDYKWLLLNSEGGDRFRWTIWNQVWIYVCAESGSEPSGHVFFPCEGIARLEEVAGNCNWSIRKGHQKNVIKNWKSSNARE